MLLRTTLIAAAIATAAVGWASPATRNQTAPRAITEPPPATACHTQNQAHDQHARLPFVEMATTRAVNTPIQVAHATATAELHSTCRRG
jgi:hypothetical protein